MYTHQNACDASILFYFNHTSTTQIYTLSLHDALPIYPYVGTRLLIVLDACPAHLRNSRWHATIGLNHLLLLSKGDRKSTRLNSSHRTISYAVFCLKKKKN